MRRKSVVRRVLCGTRVFCCLCVLTAFSGCERALGPGLPCVQREEVPTGGAFGPDELDLLLMVDNSESMGPAQAALAAALPGFLAGLAAGELRNPETGQLLTRFPRVRSLRVGVVSSDMGTGGFRVPTCGSSRFGDDGLLLDRGDLSDARCLASYPSFFEFERDPAASPESEAERAAALGGDVGCVARLGTDGCSFEQPLDAILKAVTPSTSTITFQEGTSGNGTVNRVDGAGLSPDIADDDAFVRDDSLLVVIALTDEDDCSTFEPDLFNPASTRFTGDLNLRCFNFPEAVYPLSRFRDGLLALRPSNPSLLLYAPIVGVPADLVPARNPREAPDLAALLEDARMQERVDADGPSGFAASCDAPGGLARPPRRMVTLAQELGERGALTSVQSLCAGDLRPALFGVLQRIAVELGGGVCLTRPLRRAPTGLVDCTLFEFLPAEGEPAETECARLPGRTLERRQVGPTGAQEICRIAQLTPETFDRAVAGETDAAGWVYDDFRPELAFECSEAAAQRIRFVPGSDPVPGAGLRFFCREVLGQQLPPTAITIGDSCFAAGTQAEADDFCLRATAAPSLDEGLNERLRDALPAGGRLFCEPLSRTCQLGCASDRDCPGPARCAAPVTDPPSGDPPAFPGACIDPTCTGGSPVI